MRNTIKLYSLALPLMVMPVVADITLSGIWDYLRGMEFRAFAAELVSSVISGTVDAFIVAGVSGIFAASGG